MLNGLALSGRGAGLSIRLAAIGCCAFWLTGCLGAPTYGTDKRADEQLLEDVTGILSLGPSGEEPIEYKPRPELVPPPDANVLPPPQDSVAGAGNPAWPESPEQRRKRLRAEATVNRDDPTFVPEIASDIRSQPGITSSARLNQPGNFETPASSANQRAEFNRRLAQSRQGSPRARRYLSEPPLDYRQPAETAPADDIGEDEWKKESRLKREARQRTGQRGWRDMMPWL